MNISFNWLKQYINLDVDYKKIEEPLTSIGLEVEGTEEYESVKGGLEGLVIGQVLTCAKHPNADKLSLTTVNIGQGEPLNIVCGAPNVAAGQKVLVATIGTTLYINNEEIKIKKGKIRGEVSEGMICAEDEIGLGHSHDGIIVLPENAIVGTLAKDYFKVEKDIVFAIGLTPNRIDCGSHFGVARDLAAFFRKPGLFVTKPSVENFIIDNKLNPVEVIVEDNVSCPRYTGLTISGLVVKESPEWLQNRLKALGMKPINNVVDITNFVLHETGQPLHAFDLEEVTDKKIIVKTLPEKTKFITLDEKERELTARDLMICNSQEGMCIGGVLGGTKSGVTTKTTAIFLESAYFNPVSIRRTSKHHDIFTDASFRFERGVDPDSTIYALKRAAMLIKEIAGGTISSDITDIYPKPFVPVKTTLTFAYLKKLIGKDIEKDVVKEILARLDMKILKETSESLELEIPLYRVDVTRPADVVEEILRIYGYNNVEISENMHSNLSYIKQPDENKLRNVISDLLSANGFNEIMSNSLTKSSYYEQFKLFPKENTVMIINPLSSDLNGMRQTLLFNGLEAVIHNINRKSNNLKLYEYGNCYKYDANAKGSEYLAKYSESKHISILITGDSLPVNWNTSKKASTFFELKSAVELVLKKLAYQVDKLVIDEISDEIFSYGLSVSINGSLLVSYGLLNKSVLKNFDINQEVYYADIQWDNVIANYSNNVKFSQLPKYPEVHRDLALLVDKNVKFSQIKNLAFETEKKLLKQVSIFDIYEGEKLGNNKKSYAVSFVLQDDNQTLTDQIIEKTMNRFIKVFEDKLGAAIR